MKDPEPVRIGDKLAKIARNPEILNKLPAEDREKAIQLILQREETFKLGGSYFFKPNIAQAKLLYSVNDSGEMPRTMGLEGSNKVGKTCMLANWGIAMSCGFYPWLQDLQHFYNHRCWKVWERIALELGFAGGLEEIQEKYSKINIPRYKVPNVGLVLGETYTESVDKKLVPEFLRWIPKDWVLDERKTTKKNQQGIINKITYSHGPAKGSIIHFRSYKSPASEFEGIDQGWIGYDEPPPEDIYISCQRGNIVADGRTMFSFTALKEPWIYYNLINKAAYHWI